MGSRVPINWRDERARKREQMSKMGREEAVGRPREPPAETAAAWGLQELREKTPPCKLRPHVGAKAPFMG